MKKKYLFFSLTLVLVLIVAIFFREPATKDDLFIEYNEDDLTDIHISHVMGELKQLSVSDKEYFISLLDEADFKKKLISNVQKFNTDVVIYIDFSNSDDSMILKFEFERQILAVQGRKTKKLEQFLLVNDTKITEFIKKNANE